MGELLAAQAMMAAKLKRLAVIVITFLVCGGVLTARELYELRGKVRLEDGQPIRNVVPVVFLEQSLSSFTVHTLVDPGGDFKFKQLEPANYQVIVSVPDWGQMSRSIEVGPTTADRKGRVFIELEFVPAKKVAEALMISPSQLAVPDKARREYQSAIKKLGERKTEEAIEHLEKALEIAPQFSLALNHLGTIAYNGQRYSEAEKYFRQALDSAPESYIPLVNLGGVLLTLGKTDEALERNLSAVARRPDDPLAQSQLGQTYFGLSQLQSAETHLKRAKALDPAHFSYPQLVLAEIYRLRGDKGGLIRELEQFLSYHPDVPAAPKLQAVIEALREGNQGPREGVDDGRPR